MEAVLRFEFLVKETPLSLLFIFLEVSASLRYNARFEAVLFCTKQHLFFNMLTACFSSLWYIEFAAIRFFSLLSSLGWWQILIIWLSFMTIILTKMSYIPFIGIESGNLSKLVKGKFLEMFLNIVIKIGWTNTEKNVGTWECEGKPRTAILMPTIASRVTGNLEPHNLVHSGGNWTIKTMSNLQGRI